MELGEFLSRPVKVHTYTWAPETNISFTIDPWTLYLTQPEINKKLANYAYLRADMRIKVTVSGTPFHYGRAIAYYKPLHTSDDVVSSHVDEEVMLGSQRQHFYINPTESAGGEMLLPFVFPKNYLDITVDDYTYLGTLSCRSLSPLHHANEDDASTIAPVDMTVYAWLENVELIMPTNAPFGTRILVRDEAEDEYEAKGPVSKPAAAVAAVSMMAGRIWPQIAPWAIATSFAAGATSIIASSMGFSRPPIIDKVQIYKPQYAGNHANVDQADTTSKLSMMSKQELTIDPRTVGVGSEDEMMIRRVAGVESWFYTAQWLPLDAQDATIFSVNPGPDLRLKLEGDDKGVRFVSTPLAHMSSLFRYWRGGIKFRFMVIASKYHRGRLRIAWDPKGAPGGTQVAMSKIIDISQETDFEFVVGYGQDVSYLPTEQIGPTGLVENYGAGHQTVKKYANGVLSISVVDALAAPGDSDPVYIACFASAGDDFEVAVPTDTLLKKTTFYPAPIIPRIEVCDEVSEVGMNDDQDQADAPTGASTRSEFVVDSAVPNMSKVHFGECIVSLRTLLKRYAYVDSDAFTYDEGDVHSITLAKETLPRYPGYTSTPEDTDFNHNLPTLLNWIVPMYAAWRGSIRYKYLLDHAGPARLSVHRDPEDLNTFDSTIPTGSSSEDVTRITGVSGIGGAYYTPAEVNPCAEVELPFYSPLRFAPGRFTSAVDYQHPFATDHEIERHFVQAILYPGWQTNNFGDPLAPTKIPTQSHIHRFVSVGEDFSCFWFQGTIPFYINGL